MTLESIDPQGLKPAELRDQPAPMLTWARIADLRIDRSYQRPLTPASRRAIRAMADGWDWTRYQPILCAPAEGGLLVVVDGQHRAHAGLLAGIEELPAMTVPMTRAQQAAGFAAVNRDRIAINALAIYRAELTAGADWAQACREAVEAAGCRIATSNPSAMHKKPGMVYAIGIIRRMVTRGEAAAVTAGLRAIRESDAGRVMESYAAPVLNPWLSALARDNRFLRLDLAPVFDGIDFETLRENATRAARTQNTAARGLMIDAIAQRLKDVMAGH
ncbi:hypothetical protein ACSSV4_000610 [Roseovarius sp. MBR-154]|jgi:hypothetical protein